MAGALFVAGVTGVATVRAVAPTPGEAVVIAGGGGVGVFAVQLAVRTGARVIALASERHHAWLLERGAFPVAYGDGVSARITAAAQSTPVAAFIDLVGGGYVELALELGIARDRIDTIVDFPAIEKYGVKGDGGAAAASAATLAELAEVIAAGDLFVPIQRSYALYDVRAAFTELEAGHTGGRSSSSRDRSRAQCWAGVRPPVSPSCVRSPRASRPGACIRVDDEAGVCGEQRLLSFGIAMVCAACVRVDELADRQAVEKLGDGRHARCASGGQSVQVPLPSQYGGLAVVPHEHSAARVAPSTPLAVMCRSPRTSSGPPGRAVTPVGRPAACSGPLAAHPSAARHHPRHLLGIAAVRQDPRSAAGIEDVRQAADALRGVPASPAARRSSHR